MIDTKNIILGMIGVFITIYTLLIGLNILMVQSQKNQLENHLARIVENTLENNFRTGNTSDIKQILEDELEQVVAENVGIFVEVLAVDLEKGILSVEVTETIPTVMGKNKEIRLQKTAIMERKAVQSANVTVKFLVDEEVYKEYQIGKGEVCPMPKIPDDRFIGWIEYGSTEYEPVKEIGNVWEDQVYLAVME